MRGAGCTINDMWDRKLDKAVGMHSVCSGLAGHPIPSRLELTYFPPRTNKRETVGEGRHNSDECVLVPGGSAFYWSSGSAAIKLV
jgi:hypothetical protein